MQLYVIKFVSDIRLVGGFFRVLWFHPTDGHDITEILLKVALNTITPTPSSGCVICLVIHFIPIVALRLVRFWGSNTVSGDRH
jgi:hypothetical protein